jgi:pSer/pThr/pTyr-binding forkhead associated (FHA) protein
MGRLFLTIVAGPAEGQKLRVPPDGLLIVREPPDGTRGEDPAVSRMNALFDWRPDGGLTVEDLRSSNGTFVNGQRVTAAQALRPGDTIKAGSTTLRVDSVLPNGGAAGAR